MSASLELQKAIRNCLIGAAEVTGLVPEASILDTNERPAPRPSIILGQDQETDEGDAIARNRIRITHDVHIWVAEASTETAKRIAGAVRAAVHADRFTLGAGYHCADARVSGTRILRDEDGETSHGIVTISALVEVLT